MLLSVKLFDRHNDEYGEKDAHKAPHLLLLCLTEEALQPRRVAILRTVSLHVEAQRASKLYLGCRALGGDELQHALQSTKV